MNKIGTVNKIFEGKEIRSVWDSEKGDYYFSVVDVIKALTDSKDASDYWTTLKRRLLKDGKLYKIDCLDTKGILRLIESIPSPKA